MSIDQMIDEAEAIQKEMHSFIDNVRKTQRGKKLSYEDLRTVFFLMKIAELKKDIEFMENNVQSLRKNIYTATD